MPLMMLIMNCVSLAIVWFGAKQIDLGNFSNWRYDGVYAICNANYYVIYHDFNGYDYDCLVPVLLLIVLMKF